MRELVSEDAQLERLGTGFTFTEGPLWNPDGFLLFSDMPGDVRRRWDEAGGVTEVANPSNKGNGMTFDLEGRLIVCEHVTSSLVRMDPDGTGSRTRGARLPPRRQGAQLPQRRRRRSPTARSTSPTRPTGACPASGSSASRTSTTRASTGSPPGGGDPELVLDDFGQPNGLCFTADESLLYVNDTDHAHIRVFDVDADGRPVNGRVFADGIGSGVARRRRPRRRHEARRAAATSGSPARASTAPGASSSSAPRASTSGRSTSPGPSATSTGAARTGTAVHLPVRRRCTASSATSPATVSPT